VKFATSAVFHVFCKMANLDLPRA